MRRIISIISLESPCFWGPSSGFFTLKKSQDANGKNTQHQSDILLCRQAFLQHQDTEQGGEDDHTTVEAREENDCVHFSGKVYIQSVVCTAEHPGQKRRKQEGMSGNSQQTFEGMSERSQAALVAAPCSGQYGIDAAPCSRQPGFEAAKYGTDKEVYHCHDNSRNQHHIAGMFTGCRLGEGFKSNAHACGCQEKQNGIDSPSDGKGSCAFLVGTHDDCHHQQYDTQNLNQAYAFLPDEDADRNGEQQGAVADQGCDGNRSAVHSSRLKENKQCLEQAVQKSPEEHRSCNGNSTLVDNKQDNTPDHGADLVKPKNIIALLET